MKGNTPYQPIPFSKLMELRLTKKHNREAQEEEKQGFTIMEYLP